jgi:hypothetical protein
MGFPQKHPGTADCWAGTKLTEIFISRATRRYLQIPSKRCISPNSAITFVRQFPFPSSRFHRSIFPSLTHSDSLPSLAALHGRHARSLVRSQLRKLSRHRLLLSGHLLPRWCCSRQMKLILPNIIPPASSCRRTHGGFSGRGASCSKMFRNGAVKWLKLIMTNVTLPYWWAAMNWQMPQATSQADYQQDRGMVLRKGLPNSGLRCCALACKNGGAQGSSSSLKLPRRAASHQIRTSIALAAMALRHLAAPGGYGRRVSMYCVHVRTEHAKAR